MCLEYESLRLPETSIFKWNGYKSKLEEAMHAHREGDIKSNTMITA